MYTSLISAAELASHLDDPGWRVVDCRFSLADSELGRRHYDEGHLPGAVYAHLDDDLAAPVGATTGRHPLPAAAEMVSRLEQWGVSSGAGESGDSDTQVVVYDDCGGAIAVRLWWMLRWLGHPAAAVLDGGYSAWLAAGLPVTQEAPQIESGHFHVQPDDGRWCSVHELAGLLQRGECLLLDCRDSERYQGRVEPIDPVAGHVPGACNLPYIDNLDTHGRFKEPEVLRAMYESLLDGRNPAEVVHMCGSGVTACHNLLAMEIAGLPGSRPYPGSWSEWISNPARLVAGERSQESES
ncbi:MAG: sulfurtransferase [Pseudomonadota bacterium]|nr:sulfurtransferase [Pseudomonadota bacterium]